MRVLTTAGVEVLPVTDPFERSLVGYHWNAIKHFLDTGEVWALDPFIGASVAGRRLQADPDEIEDWGRQGELEIDHIYPGAGGW